MPPWLARLAASLWILACLPSLALAQFGYVPSTSSGSWALGFDADLRALRATAAAGNRTAASALFREGQHALDPSSNRPVSLASLLAPSPAVDASITLSALAASRGGRGFGPAYVARLLETPGLTNAGLAEIQSAVSFLILNARLLAELEFLESECEETTREDRRATLDWAWALYAGEEAGSTSLYAFAEQRAMEANTMELGRAKVNRVLLELFREAQESTGSCAALRPVFRNAAAQLLVPLLQATISSSRTLLSTRCETGRKSSSQGDEEDDECALAAAEFRPRAAALLPHLRACGPAPGRARGSDGSHEVIVDEMQAISIHEWGSVMPCLGLTYLDVVGEEHDERRRLDVPERAAGAGLPEAAAAVITGLPSRAPRTSRPSRSPTRPSPPSLSPSTTSRPSAAPTRDLEALRFREQSERRRAQLASMTIGFSALAAVAVVVMGLGAVLWRRRKAVSSEAELAPSSFHRFNPRSSVEIDEEL